MDVVFREQESFYGEPTDLADVSPDVSTNDVQDADHKIGGDIEEEDSDTVTREMIVGVIPAGEVSDDDSEDTSEAVQEQTQGELENTQSNESLRPQSNERRYLKVYTRRHRPRKEQVQEEERVSERQDTEVLEEPPLEVKVPTLSHMMT